MYLRIHIVLLPLPTCIKIGILAAHVHVGVDYVCTQEHQYPVNQTWDDTHTHNYEDNQNRGYSCKRALQGYKQIHTHDQAHTTTSAAETVVYIMHVVCVSRLTGSQCTANSYKS